MFNHYVHSSKSFLEHVPLMDADPDPDQLTTLVFGKGTGIPSYVENPLLSPAASFRLCTYKRLTLWCGFL